MFLVTANIFQPLIDVFEAVLKFFHNSVGVPWGWSIVLLTVLIRLVLVPLTVKQFHSMQALQRVQPEMKALQAKYKDDKQRQQQEMMKFYKENNVNPLGSCLPMVAQLPVFISLFYMLRQSLRKDICPAIQTQFQNSYALKHHVSHLVAAGQTTPCGVGHGASFLFIGDLTNKANGVVLVVLILLYVGTQLASSLMMATPGMDKTQRQIMLVMPLFFVLFVVSFPAGVIVYWITTNTWTMGQQYVLRRRLGPMRLAAAAVGAKGAASPSAGGPGGSGPGSGSGGSGPGSAGSQTDGKSNGRSDNGPPPATGGLGGLLRGRAKPEQESTPVVAGSRAGSGAAPPRPPRKKKKRSGRRR